MSHKNDDEILIKVKEILDIAVDTAQDKALQEFIRFIFTDEFKTDSITLPVKKGENYSYKFLEKYIELVYSLFQLKNEERNKLYNILSLSKDYSEISHQIDQLNKLMEKKGDILSKIKEDKINQLNEIKSYLFNLISNQPTTLFSKLDKFHFYFILYFPSMSTMKFLLYSIIKNKFMDVLGIFDYQECCPNFDDETCLNLIILFFDNIKTERRELLFIFALLILQYELIFKYRINKKIPKFILQHAAEKTYPFVVFKTLKNSLIFEYTYNEYLSNLDVTIYLSEEKKRKIANSYIDNKYESQINKNQIIILNNNKNPHYSKNSKENEAFGIPDNKEQKAEEMENSEDDNFGEEKKNEIKSKENKTKFNKINIPFSSSDENESNIQKEEKNIVNQISQEEEKEENRKDINNLSKEEINNLSIEELYSILLQKLSELEKKNEGRFSELEKKFLEREKKENEFSKKFLELEKKGRENEKKFSELKSEIESLKGMVSSIQMMTFSKNFLNIFKNDLSQEEKEIIEKDKSKEGEIILKSLKRIYPSYIDTENFKTVSEIVEKSGEALNKGNDFEKNLFMKNMGISDDDFGKCLNFISKYCGKEKI